MIINTEAAILYQELKNPFSDASCIKNVSNHFSNIKKALKQGHIYYMAGEERRLLSKS